MKVSRFLLTLVLLTAPAGAAFGQMYGYGPQPYGYGPQPYGVRPVAYHGLPCAADPNSVAAQGLDEDPDAEDAGPGNVVAPAAPGAAPATPQLAPLFSDANDGFSGFLNRSGGGDGMFARNNFGASEGSNMSRGFRFGEQRIGSGGMYARTDAGYWHLAGPSRPVIATLPNGTANPVTRMDTSDPDFQHELLPIVTVGYVMGNTIAVEGTVIYKDDFDAYSDLRSPLADLDVLTFGRIVPAPPSNATDYNNASWLRQTVATGIHSYEIGIAETSRFFNFTAGIRYIELRDRLNIQTYKINGVGGTNISDATVGTYNWLLGSQMGVRTGFTYDIFTVSVFGKAGLFFNNGNASMLVRDANNTVALASTNVFRTGGQNEAFVGELGANLSIRVLPGVALRGGYNALVIQDVMKAADQLQTSTQSFNASGLLNDYKGTAFFYGPSAGVEFRW